VNLGGSSRKPGQSFTVWKQLFELLQGALFIGRDVVQLRREVEQLRKEMNEVHRALNQIAHSFEHLSEREKLEREKWVLQLENNFAIT